MPEPLRNAPILSSHVFAGKEGSRESPHLARGRPAGCPLASRPSDGRPLGDPSRSERSDRGYLAERARAGRGLSGRLDSRRDTVSDRARGRRGESAPENRRDGGLIPASSRRPNTRWLLVCGAHRSRDTGVCYSCGPSPPPRRRGRVVRGTRRAIRRWTVRTPYVLWYDTTPHMSSGEGPVGVRSIPTASLLGVRRRKAKVGWVGGGGCWHQ